LYIQIYNLEELNMPDLASLFEDTPNNSIKVPKPSVKPAIPPIPGMDQPTSYLEPHYADLYNSWKTDPTPQASSSLLKTIDPVIKEALKSYGGTRQESPTLRSKAKLLALEAMQKYDPTRSKLKTHLLTQFQGLRRMAAKENQIISVPEQVMLDQGHLREAENRLRDKLGRDPSDWELIDETGLSLKRISYIRSMKPTFAEGKLTTVDEEGSSMSVPAIAAQQTEDKGWQEFIYSDLHPIDQVIMEHTLGMNNKKVLSNQEIARKLGLSPGAISQRKARIQQLLDRREDLGI
jgi:DNA-directed RNA polymerase specialized sigma subunit